MDDYIIDGDLAFSNSRDALKFYQEQYHKKKEWVGLTDDEIRAILDCGRGGVVDIKKAEQKLKDKNT